MIAELLSPAGNLLKLKIACAYGADALYGSVNEFSLRSRASADFNYESFKEGIEYAHRRGKRFYIAINGFPFNSMIKSLSNHIAKMRDLSPDAFIVATPGVVSLCRQIAPNIPLHLSTQANILNYLDAEVYFNLGVKRIVLAREASLKDAVMIKERLKELELEVFVHGSMCFAFSGRCLISALQSGRMPNRGSCKNDCRFPYEYYVRNKDSGTLMRLEEEEGVGTHIFNSKDLNLSTHVKEILDTGVISALKIEGRTKSPYYAGIATRAYRSAINDYKAGLFNPSIYEAELNTLKNRGFSEGYLINRPHERMDTQNHLTSISDGTHQVLALVGEDGLSAMAKGTLRVGEETEIVSPLDAKVEEVDNEIGRITLRDGRTYITLKKIELVGAQAKKGGDALHSGNIHPFALPSALPPFSFIRIRSKEGEDAPNKVKNELENDLKNEAANKAANKADYSGALG